MTHTIFYFLLGVLAAHRLALLLTKEDGPAWVFRKIRNLPPKKSSVHEGIRCMYCTSVWMAALVTGYYFYLDIVNIYTAPIWWLAMSSGAIVVNQAWTKG